MVRLYGKAAISIIEKISANSIKGDVSIEKETDIKSRIRRRRERTSVNVVKKEGGGRCKIFNGDVSFLNMLFRISSRWSWRLITNIAYMFQNKKN